MYSDMELKVWENKGVLDFWKTAYLKGEEQIWRKKNKNSPPHEKHIFEKIKKPFHLFLWVTMQITCLLLKLQKNCFQTTLIVIRMAIMAPY